MSKMRLYAGGQFTTAGPWAANRIASWNGTAWAAMGAGFDDGEVRALAQFDDGFGSHLYAGGSFQASGGTPVAHIARWDGNAWKPVGTGTSDVVYSLAVFDEGGGPALYAAGSFKVAGGLAATGIAKWDGTEWSRVPGTEDYWDVYALAVFDAGNGARLYAVGQTPPPMQDSSPAGMVASGSRWGADSTVRSARSRFSTTAEALYVGGDFRNAGGVPAKRLAKWDGTRWSAVGSDLAQRVEQGIPPDSPFYNMERMELKSYEKYIKLFERSLGGAPGIDY